MKNNITSLAVLLTIILTQPSITQQQSLEEKYQGLQTSPSYQGMSPIAIAASIEDLRAISHFSPRSSRAELITARAILEGKIDLLRDDLKQVIPRDSRDQADKIIDRDAIKAHINRLADVTQRLSEMIAHK